VPEQWETLRIKHTAALPNDLPIRWIVFGREFQTKRPKEYQPIPTAKLLDPSPGTKIANNPSRPRFPLSQPKMEKDRG